MRFMKSQNQKETKKLTIMKCNMEEKIEKILEVIDKETSDILAKYELPKDAAILKKVEAKMEKVGDLFIGGEAMLDEEIGIVVNGPAECMGKKYRLKKHFTEDIEIAYRPYYFVDNLDHSYFYIIND